MKKISFLIVVLVLFASCVFAGEEGISGSSRYVPNEVIVKFKPSQINIQKSTGLQSMRSFASREALTTKSTIVDKNISVMQINDGQTVDEVIQDLQNDPNVEHVQPNFIYHIQIANPNDTYFDIQRGLKNIGQTIQSITGTSGADIQWLQAMDIRSGISDQQVTGTIVAVIDDGVQITHPDLVNQMRNGTNCLSYTGFAIGGCQGGFSFIGGNMTNSPMPTGDDTHGTHVAGIIGAEMSNGQGIAGVNPHAKIMGVRAGQNETLQTTDIIKAFAFASYNGAKIVNASRGGGGATCNHAYDELLYDAIRDFPGIVVVAAGNDNKQHLQGWFFGPADYGVTTSCRTALDNIISVGATTNTDVRASFSDYGTSISIGAPGQYIASTVDADTYAYMNGTSMATPFVAGAVSLAWSMRPELSYLEIKNAIIDQAEYVAALSGLVKNGKRLNVFQTLQYLYQAQIALLSGYIGTGVGIAFASGSHISGTQTYFERTTPSYTGNLSGYHISIFFSGQNYAQTGTTSTGMTISLLSGDGTYIFSVYPILSGGATGNTLSSTFMLDNTGPIMTIGSPTSGTQLTGISHILTGTLSDQSTPIAIQVNGVSSTGMTSWSQSVSLTGGENIFTITGIDSVGNTTSTGITLIRVNYISDIVDTISSGTSVEIAFTTDMDAQVFVNYGTSSGALLTNVAGSTTDTHHTITIDNLLADTIYYYQVYGISNGYTGTISSLQSFQTLPVVDIDTNDETTIATGSVFISGATATGAVFISTGTLIIPKSGNANNYLQLDLSGFSFTTSGGLWDMVLMSPVVGSNPSLGAGGLPVSGTNNGSTTTARNILLTIQAGSDVDSLIANGGYFTINVVVPSGTSGNELRLYRSENGSTWTGNSPQATCTLDTNKTCRFITDHLSYFTTVKETTSNNTPSGGGGGGGGGILPKTCTSSDLICTASGYILKTGADCQGGNLGNSCILTTTGNIINTGSQMILFQNMSDQQRIIGSPFSSELNNAYLYGYRIGITTMPTVQQANMTGTLIRKHLAKMISNFAIRELKKVPNTGMTCNFIDMINEDTEMKLYSKLACQLGLMGLDTDGIPTSNFNPDNEVTRAQFGSVLSRALRGNRYNGGEPYYILHLDALQDASIMKQIDAPENQELRGRVMLMLMRSVQSNE